jgi:predicted SprT family Zn-dependent metalloprotease
VQGVFFPGKRKHLDLFPPKIEIASYLAEEPGASQLIYDTLAHEMIHYWLWVRGRPFDHTSEFIAKMEAMGTALYNPAPRFRQIEWRYRCECCGRQFKTKKERIDLACLDCCTKYSGGRYDSQFKLILVNPK